MPATIGSEQRLPALGQLTRRPDQMTHMVKGTFDQYGNAPTTRIEHSPVLDSRWRPAGQRGTGPHCCQPGRAPITMARLPTNPLRKPAMLAVEACPASSVFLLSLPSWWWKDVAGEVPASYMLGGRMVWPISNLELSSALGFLDRGNFNSLRQESKQ